MGCPPLSKRKLRARVAPFVLVLSVGGTGACAAPAPAPSEPRGSETDSRSPAPAPPANSDTPDGPGRSDDTTDARPPVDDAPPQVTVEVRVIHQAHRAIPGAMFGGWGPHLGHLVRRGPAADAPDGEQWFVDDACAPGACDVNRNTRLDYLRLRGNTWERVDSQPLPAGVQQNVGSVLVGDRIIS